MSLTQLVFSALAFASFGGEGVDGVVQSKLLAPVGFAESDEDGAHQETGNDRVNFRGLANEREGVARIDEPVEDSEKSEKAAQNGRREAGDHRGKCYRDVQRDVESDMAENGIKQPAEQDREDGCGDGNGVALDDTLRWKRSKDG